MKIAIVKYNAGNIQSVTLCLKRLGVDAMITDNLDELMSADKVIFPGVGEAGSAMKYLTEKRLDQLIPQLQQPVLGICLGMQLMCSYSEESNTTCMGIFPEKVRGFNPTLSKEDGNNAPLKIPHMGWNTIYSLKGPLLNDIAENEFMYFVHGYYVETGSDTIAKSNYGIEFSSAIQKNNFYGVQFHAEKSAKWGEKIIFNFLRIV